MATWDKERNLESARVLRGLEPRLLVLGHGPELRDPDKATVRAIERAIARSPDDPARSAAPAQSD